MEPKEKSPPPKKKRKTFTIEQKVDMIEEAMKPGASQVENQCVIEATVNAKVQKPITDFFTKK